MRTILILLGALPIIAANSFELPVKPSETSQSSKSCGCTTAENDFALKNKGARGGITPMRRACPVRADLDLLCTQGGTTLETWCNDKGIFQTCESNGDDNDGDNIFSEHHFMMKRYLVNYACESGTFIVCGNWQHMKIGGGTSNQDVCCSSAQTEPPCPPNSCKY